MAEEKPDAGNDRAGDAGNAGQPADRTPPGDGPNAGEDSANLAALVKTQQESVAKAKEAAAQAERRVVEVTAENARLKAAQSPAAPTERVDPKQKAFRETAEWARGKDGLGPDPVAASTLYVAERLDIVEQALVEKEHLLDIEDKDLRRKTLEHLNANRSRLGDVKAALAEVRMEGLENVEAENKKLSEALREARAPDGKAPPTHHRDSPASQSKPTVYDSLDEFEDAMKGKSTFERLAMQEQVDKGLVKFKR